LTAVLLCCGLSAVAWFVTKHTPAKIAVAIDHQRMKNDTFANEVKRRIIKVASVSANHTRNVIFDNDAAIDDALALLLIGNDPSVSLKAITVAGTGEAHGKAGAENMSAIIAMLGKPDVPVAYGHARPLSSAGKPFPAFLRDTMDNMLAGKGINKSRKTHITDNAVALIHQVVESSNEKVTILATGPLTNIAEFFMQYPQLKSKIERIVIMGGAVNVPGNVEGLAPEANNKVSEWNFYADPLAVQKVFNSHVPITLVALDATNQVPMNKKFYQSLASAEQPELKLSYELLNMFVERIGPDRFYNDVYFWDGLAAMVMLDSTLAESVKMPLLIDATNGQVKVAKKGAPHAADVDVITRINNPEAALLNYVAMVKSNHIYAQRQFHHINRVTANLGRSSNQYAGVKFARVSGE